MGEGFFNLQHILELIRLDLYGLGANVIWVGQSIFAIGALLYVAKLSYEGLLGANLLSTKMLRIFGVAIIMLMYPEFMQVIDGGMMAINNGLGSTYIEGDTRVTDILKTRDLNPLTDTDDNLLGIEDIHAQEDEEAAGFVNQITETISGTLDVTKWIGEKLYWAMMRMMEEVLFRISHAVLMIINFIRVFFLVVLYSVGPLVIGMSAFPGFESVFIKWLGRYISVHLWLGIGNIYEAISVRLWQVIVENGGMWTSGVGLEDTVNTVMLTTWSWVFLLTLIVGYITIPVVAGWIVNDSGIGQAGAYLAAIASKGAVKGGTVSVANAASPPRYRK